MKFADNLKAKGLMSDAQVKQVMDLWKNVRKTSREERVMPSKLSGMDMYAAGITRSDLLARLQNASLGIARVFINNDDFDDYVNMIGVRSLAVVRELPNAGGVDFKIELQIVVPFSAGNFAEILSSNGAKIAYPEDNAAQYSNYIVYFNGKPAFTAALEVCDVTARGDNVFRLAATYG